MALVAHFYGIFLDFSFGRGSICRFQSGELLPESGAEVLVAKGDRFFLVRFLILMQTFTRLP